MYRLTFFDRVISGDLMPANPKINDFSRHKILLRLYPKKIAKRFVLELQKTNSGEYSLYNITGRFVELSQTSKGLLKIDNLPETLIVFVLHTLKIRRESIIQLNHKPCKSNIGVEIIAELNPFELTPDEAKYFYYDMLLSKETEQIKRKFKTDIIRLKTEKEIELYVQNHQNSIGHLICEIYERLSDSDKAGIYEISIKCNTSDIYKMIFGYIETLSLFIEKYYAKYLNFDLPVPKCIRLVCFIEINKKLQFVQPIVKNKLSKEISDIVMVPLNKLSLLSFDENFLYRNMIYHRFLINDLYTEFSKPHQEVDDKTVSDILYILNFNSVRFLKYLTKQITESVNTKENLPEKIDVLLHYLKNYNQHQVKTNVAYNFQMAALKDMLVRWINEELSYLQTQLDYFAEKKLLLPTSKVEFNLSVAQIGYITKMLCDTGIITNDNRLELVRVIADKIRTKNTKSISPGSLGSKFYAEEGATKETVKGIIIKLLNHINRK